MNDSRDRIVRIRALLDRARTLWRASEARGESEPRFFGARKHRYELSPPVSAETLARWEADFQVELPEAYRVFLTRLGEQGAGPFYGLDSPWALSRRSPEARAGYGAWMRAPCTLVEDLAQGGPDDTRWLERLGGPDWEERFDRDAWSPSQGTLSLVQVGCGEELVLVLNGPLRGRVFQLCEVSQVPLLHEAPDFLAWYEDWLEGVVAPPRGLA